MTSGASYSFRKATLDDLALLRTWRGRPHVLQWWQAMDPSDTADLTDPRVTRCIVSHRGRPFAFMQDYTVHGWQAHHFDHLPEGTRGIDQYIGEAAMLGLGHGTGFIGARMQMLFDAGVPMIATDPHPTNDRAIAVYIKLGFEPLGPAQSTQWGLVLPLVVRNSRSG